MQSSEWHTASPQPKKSRLIRSKEKVMLTAFFDIDGLVHHKFVPPAQCYWSFLRASFAEVAQCSSEEAAQQVAGTVVSASRWCTKPHIAYCAAIPCWEKHSSHHPTTVLSGSCSKWLLAVPYSVIGPQGVMFWNHGGRQIECDGQTPEGSKRSLLPVFSPMAGSMEKVCVCKGPTSKVIR
jgi:hypothetical protein